MILRFALPICLWCFLIPTTSFEQPFVTEKEVKKKVAELYKEAKQHLSAGRETEAFATLTKVLDKAPNFIDARLMQADLKLLTGDLPGAEQAFEAAIALAPDYSVLAYFLLAEAEYRQGKYAEAKPRLQHYLDSGKARGRRLETTKKMMADIEFAVEAIKRPVPFSPESLGPGINTDRPEYLPSLTANSALLVYATRIGPRNEDIYFSEFKDGSWTEGQALPGLNTAFSEISPSISANGKAMVFTSNFQSEKNFNLYFSAFENNRWGDPKPIGPPINTEGWESQPSLSADGKELYFVSNRGGGQGQLDIWMSALGEDGRWRAPVNLGPNINTAYKEQAPFIHADGQTLYFMSTGHPGLGQYDLFVSRRQPDGSWGTPQNLGYPINTAANEGALVVSLDGKRAFFDSDQARQTTEQEYIGNADLYTFELYPEARPNPATYVEAYVYDIRTRKPLLAQVDFVRLPEGVTHISDRTDKSGNFLVVLPTGKDYALNISKEGYAFHSEHFALQEITDRKEPFQLKIGLQPLETPGTTTAEPVPIVLNNVFFETGSAALQPVSTGELNRLRDLLVENPEIRIQINGHTDDVGEEADNQTLSENRAKAVFEYLIEQGIAEDRMSYKGFGESNPIATNDTSEGRQENRRTEFIILK